MVASLALFVCGLLVGWLVVNLFPIFGFMRAREMKMKEKMTWQTKMARSLLRRLRFFFSFVSIFAMGIDRFVTGIDRLAQRDYQLGSNPSSCLPFQGVPLRQLAPKVM